MNKKLLHELFTDQASSRPDAIAVSTSKREISYKELDIFSNILAHQLLKLKVNSNKLVAVVMHKGWEQVVAVLGILKAGAAYLPIDPSESKERLQHLLSLGQAKITVTQQEYENKLTWPKDQKIIVVQLGTPVISETATPPHLSHQTEEDLAYVTFTSGSTGTPKGVMITHKSVCNTILDINSRFSVTPKDNIFSVSSLIFDLSVYDIFGSLAAGANIVLDDPCGVNDIAKWEHLFFKEQVSIWNSVPALMDIFTEYLVSKYSTLPPHSLRLILLSGDWIPLSLPKKIWALFGKQVQIISLGGATEGSIWSILYPIIKVNPEWKSIPYGKPMHNQSFYILDKKLQPILDGGAGELFIGGEGVAKGYWHNSVQTKKQFLNHSDYGRIYKTGDLGRYLPDSNIEFLGRVDFQVKISGYRVELGAIEKQLVSYSGIKQAVVLAVKDNNNQKLGAYIILDEAHSKIGSITEKDQKTQVKGWQKVYDALFYSSDKQNKQSLLLNTAGWISSYHNENISTAQMREWVNRTIERILLLKPEHVLEVGCGTGMLLLRLAKRVKRYDSTDFSKSAIHYVKKQIERLALKNIKLIQCEAIDTRKIQKAYDTIILNSVIQYFPDLDYLINTINQYIDRIAHSGYIFVGDVRSLQHLRAFHASVLLNRECTDQTHIEWMNLLNYLVNDEDELVIDYRFFYILQKLNPAISHVEVLLKNGSFHNEMNRFRYDVILHINSPRALITDLNWQDWQPAQNYLEYIHEKIRNKQDYVAIKNIPNQRIAGLKQILEKSSFDDHTDWQSYYEKLLTEQRCHSIDPSVIYQLSSEHGYEVLMTWSEENPVEYFDIVLRKKGLSLSIKREFPNVSNVPVENLPKLAKEFANSPILPRLRHKFIADVKAFLKTQLPAYMIPDYFFILKEIPINKNGKIDRKALPRPRNIAKQEDYSKPTNSIEKTVMQLWKKTLGIQKVGLNQKFCDVGGKSLLVVQLVIQIDKTFKINLNLKDIDLSKITILELSKYIAQLWKKG